MSIRGHFISQSEGYFWCILIGIVFIGWLYFALSKKTRLSKENMAKETKKDVAE